MRITLVDDDENILMLVGDLLRRVFPTSHVTSFESPRVAIEHIQAQGTDFIVTDHGLGALSGTELVELLRAHDVRVPIVMISSNPDVRDEALQAGANQFLDKAHLEQLPQIIWSHLSRKSDS